MEIYLVGGAVRDGLLGLPVRERDYVVLGATPQQMLDLGYQQVGRDFPVFLHPHTHDEYALARSLRQAPGDADEVRVHAHPQVSLREDLSRRDLTINALAQSADGEIIDYHGGREDLRQRILRHVSPAFAEDPLRILRVARFMARYAELGFRVAEETCGLMGRMAAAGELDKVSPERIWSELEKALLSDRPSAFFQTLRDCAVLQHLLPELDRLWGVPQPPRWHPEVDTGVHVMLVVDMARRLSDDSAVVFAAMTHDLGKGLTSSEILPSHHGHEERSLALIQAVCRRIKVPARHCDIASLVARYHSHVHRADELRPSTVLKVLQAADAFRRPQRLEALLLTCEADYRGRDGFQDRPYPQAQRFRAWLQAAAGIDTAAVLGAAKKGHEAEAIYRARLSAIGALAE